MSTAATKASSFASLGIEHASTVDRVVEELRRAVFDGELESGTPLREVALADSLGVSRPTVREALTVLVSEGLASRAPHRGVQVAQADPASVSDVSRARAVLELAGAHNWARAAPADQQHVRQTLHDYQDAVSRGASYAELNARHLAVHASFVGLVGSKRLVSVADGLYAELKLALAQIDRIRRNAHDQADSHAHLVQLLEAGDDVAAEAALAAHLAGAEQAIIAALTP